MNVNSITLFRSLAVVFLLLISCVLSAKNYQVFGIVVDHFHNQPIAGLHVRLLRTDSTLVSGGVVQERLYDNPPRTIFTLPVKAEGKYILCFSMLGYETTYADVDVKFGKNSNFIDVGRFRIKEKVYKLKETTVVGSTIKMVMKGDTIVYNAAAFQLAEGSMLDALVSQLPGVELKDDGRIYVNGKFVKNLLLNGKNFFKGDPKVALDNLPAYMVDKVKVYDKAGRLSEFMGQDMGDKEYVMDVHLKRQYSIGWIANAEAGGGTEDRYLARLFGLRFTPNSRLTIFGNMNNLNDNRRPGRNGDWRPSDMPTGLQTTRVGGVSYHLEKRGENTFIFDTDNKVEHYDANRSVNTSTVTFLPSGDIFNRSYDALQNKKTTYSTRNGVDYTTNKYSFSLTENLYYQTSDNNSFGRLGTFSSAPSVLFNGSVLDTLFAPNSGSEFRRIILNRQQQESRSNSDYLSSFAYAGSSIKLGQTQLLIVEGNFQYVQVKNTFFSKNRLDYFQGSEVASADYRNLYGNSPERRRRYILNGRYDYNFADNWNGTRILTSFYYTFDNDYKSSAKSLYRLDQLPGWGESSDELHPLGTLPSAVEAWQTVIDRANSYESNIHELQHTFRLRLYAINLKKGSSKFNIEVNLTADALKQKLKYDRNSRHYPLTRNSFLPRPDAFVLAETKVGKFEWRYRMSSQAPTLTYLLDIRDDSDPLNISLGNTNLDDMHKHSTSFTFTKYSKEKQTNLHVNAGFEYTQNAIAMGLTYNRTTGVRTYKPESVNGNYIVNGRLTYVCPFGKSKNWTFYTITGVSCNHSVDLVGVGDASQSVRSVVDNLYLNETLEVDYRFGGKYSIGAKGTGNWTHATGKREDFRTINAADYNYGLTGQVELPWKIQLSTDITMYSRRGYEIAEMNKDEFVWNARLSKSCMKGNLTFILDGFDILGNLSNVQHSVNAQGRTESYYNVIPRYAMLRAIYKLNIKPKKK